MQVTETEIKEIYIRQQSKMLKLAALLLKDDAAAEDAVSEVFLSVLSAPPKNRQNMEGFLLTAVRNKCISLMRERQKSNTIRLNETIPIANENLNEDERLLRIERFIGEQLTEQTQRVLHLRFKEKRKYTEIAKEMRISEAAVYKHLAQGLGKLKQEFNP